MGNHTAGQNIVDFVELAISAGAAPHSREAALSILTEAVDRAKKRSDWSPDTEFDDAPYDEGPFRQTLIVAFGREGETYDDPQSDAFYDEVYWPFNQHFGMC